MKSNLSTIEQSTNVRYLYAFLKDISQLITEDIFYRDEVSDFRLDMQSLQVIFPILTTRKKLNKQKMSDFS